MMCSLSRYLIVGWLAGMLASSLTGSDAIGWAAAGLAVLVAHGLSRRFPARLGAGSCAVPSRSADAAPAGEGLAPRLGIPAPPTEIDPRGARSS